jgi:Zn-dependent protease with chaperone function
VSTDDALYPLTPVDVPPALTALTTRYRRLVVLVFVSLVLFFLAYLGLLAGSAGLVFLALQAPAESFPGAWLGKGLAVGLPGFFCLFLLKGLLHPASVAPRISAEITEEDQPTLFRFLRRLCRDTGAPMPHRVFVVPEVNAAAFFEPSLFRLLRPVRPNLMIGLGLVNGLTLDEFKAVLAHEFGHFSLHGMRLGRFVYVANRILAQTGLAFYRWETALKAACRGGAGGALLAGVPFLLLWLMRRAIEVVFKGINLARLALARQEEFHADRVAVGAAGSDAVVYSFRSVGLADHALASAVRELALSADQGVYSRDLFFHQERATARLREERRKEPAKESEDSVREMIVGEEAEAIPALWADHPPEEDRIRNARELPVPGPRDERTPWLLFENPERLRSRLTRRWYRVVFRVKKEDLDDPETVQVVLDGERAETTYDPRYHGLYDGRFLQPGPLAEWKEMAVPSWPRQRLLAAVDATTGDELKERLDQYHRRRSEQRLLAGVVHGGATARKKKTIEFRGKSYPVKDSATLKKLQNRVEKDLAKDREHFARLDQEVFLAHHQMAGCLEGARDELWMRYEFHLKLQDLLALLEVQQGLVNGVLARLAAQGRIEGEQAVAAIQIFREARDALQYAMRAARVEDMPALHGVTAGEAFGRRLLDEDVISDPMYTSRTIEAWWAKRFLKQLATVRFRLRRFHFKSLGGILALQERIAQAYRAGAEGERGVLTP